MKSGAQLSSLHLVVAASGGVLLYAALQGMNPLEALKELTSGRTPKPVEAKTSEIGLAAGRIGAGMITSGYTGTAGTSGSSAALVRAAERYLGVPYVWGGTSAKGMDCSGLVVLAFQDAYGITPPRSTYGQEPWSKLTKVSRNELAAGDLVFWPGHVAIYVGNGNVIHAPRPGKNVMYAPIGQAGPVGVNPSSYQRYRGGSSKPKTAEV
jgi:cell wall-associated NlpC family hydrolase